MANQEAMKTIAELGYNDVTEVLEMDDEEVAQRIETIATDAVRAIMGGQGINYVMPSRANNNQKYIPELDRIVLLNAVKTRAFDSLSSVRKTAIMTRVFQLIHQVVRKRIHVTKRDLFYTDVKLFTKQEEVGCFIAAQRLYVWPAANLLASRVLPWLRLVPQSDAVLDDVACMVGCTRTSLNVVASDKGVVVGCVTFLEDGDFIDCTRMGVGGKAIPSLVNKITDIKGTAQFVLLVEKEAAFMRLAEDRFYQRYPCVIVTGKGQPDVGTRQFVRAVKDALNVPILGLFDSDPYGLKILSVYMSSSKNMSYDSASLTCPDIKWLGLRPTDLDRYKIPEQCRLPMTAEDIETGRRLLQADFITKNEAWVKELRLMLDTKVKAEIQALSNFGFQYLTEVYLPQKLERGDWI
ncbi:uncharacterized protein MONBRDRAFT_37903 [Monosiga brevicollis MX1]|uniref:DNA topoisomerase (ATP-hydrolyzing) n=1 Tax=Monosiga brevicollis TaxID=81824 RepID=A9V4I2_MONBE|nr:uncharacterized protein MONBRDRAFT_37903 [Monosiga brevicollis MX1]EDQ87716.1 predicted protein [Monosiga brevicollis MX1]|eukprot:XP_001747636.1 hypothetical protein [Monosiga brevicollis MX1]